ncbi:MAG: IS66 family transposase zinc-finger binding domain-containing protein [Paludibacteraceae bacterium]
MHDNPITDIWQIVKELLDKLKFQNRQLTSLQEEVTRLRAKLHQYEHPKTSLNSSLPPSKDNLAVQGEKAAKLLETRSLRPKSTKPNGGQPGHKGVTLEMNPTPDEVIVHTPDYCTNCGGSLAGIPAETSETRQVLDIPLPIKPITTNHISYSKRCTCGHCTTSEFPSST